MSQAPGAAYFPAYGIKFPCLFTCRGRLPANTLSQHPLLLGPGANAFIGSQYYLARQTQPDPMGVREGVFLDFTIFRILYTRWLKICKNVHCSTLPTSSYSETWGKAQNLYWQAPQLRLMKGQVCRLQQIFIAVLIIEQLSSKQWV